MENAAIMEADDGTPRDESTPEDQEDRATVNFLDILLAQILDLYHISNNGVKSLLDSMQVTELVDRAGDKLAEHPVLGFSLLAMALSCGLPIVVFIIFAIISVIFTFAGFIFVEGTILAVGCLCLFGCLLTMVLVMSMMAVILTCIYFAFVKLAALVNNSNRTKLFISHLGPLLTGTEQEFRVPGPSIQDPHQD